MANVEFCAHDWPGSGCPECRKAREVASSPWHDMTEAPRDGTHVMLAVRTGAFVYTIEGAFHDGSWHNAAGIETEPLCWMPKVKIPDRFLPWMSQEVDV